MSADDPIALCLLGDISPEVALTRLLLGGASAEGIAERLHALRPRPDTPRWQALAALVEARRDALRGLAAEIARTGGDHAALAGTEEGSTGNGSTGANNGVARVAAFFDHAVGYSPEASVALYSLGDPRILQAATAEIVDWLEAQDLLRPGMDVLDLGCGIGRLALALAPRCRSVLGLDVSAGMVAEARRRCAALPGIRLEQTGGEDLALAGSAAFDLLLAVDSFPYIEQAGLAEPHIAEAARVLRPGGAAVLLNLSYRCDLAADRADLHRWAAAHGLHVTLAGERPFALWDGAAFVLHRPPEPDPHPPAR
ncbi:class I SAM-dependent methyltransferase [Roseomonas sp. BN140053]|uniref:class I SAM-dependent methyltransferase n=1 Tax=Roseomonas sp. BN140053 TaxID=3391898 RepID=UPI0039E991B7